MVPHKEPMRHSGTKQLDQAWPQRGRVDGCLLEQKEATVRTPASVDRWGSHDEDYSSVFTRGWQPSSPESSGTSPSTRSKPRNSLLLRHLRPHIARLQGPLSRHRNVASLRKTSHASQTSSSYRTLPGSPVTRYRNSSFLSPRGMQALVTGDHGWTGPQASMIVSLHLLPE